MGVRECRSRRKPTPPATKARLDLHWTTCRRSRFFFRGSRNRKNWRRRCANSRHQWRRGFHALLPGPTKWPGAAGVLSHDRTIAGPVQARNRSGRLEDQRWPDAALSAQDQAKWRGLQLHAVYHDSDQSSGRSKTVRQASVGGKGNAVVENGGESPKTPLTKRERFNLKSPVQPRGFTRNLPSANITSSILQEFLAAFDIEHTECRQGCRLPDQDEQGRK